MKNLRKKHILIIGIISLLSTGIILSSNWSYFIRNNHSNNNALSSYQIKTKNNIYSGYLKEESTIIFQINILKSAIKKNNIMYHQYNNIFKHNVNYIHTLKNSIQNKINASNYSILQEISILNSMKTILNNHPYNYLKFFKSRNYFLPETVSQSKINSLPSLFNIKTKEQKIYKTNINVKNISYESEETVIGIGAISSIVSSSKKLIFSKINFNYSNIYYFSNKTDSLSTFKKSKKELNQIVDNESKYTIINNTLSNSNTNQNLESVGQLGKQISESTKAYEYEIPIGLTIVLAGLGGIGTGIYIMYRHEQSRIRKLLHNETEDNTSIPETNTSSTTNSIDRESSSVVSDITGLTNAVNKNTEDSASTSEDSASTSENSESTTIITNSTKTDDNTSTVTPTNTVIHNKMTEDNPRVNGKRNIAGIRSKELNINPLAEPRTVKQVTTTTKLARENNRVTNASITSWMDNPEWGRNLDSLDESSNSITSDEESNINLRLYDEADDAFLGVLLNHQHGKTPNDAQDNYTYGQNDEINAVGDYISEPSTNNNQDEVDRDTENFIRSLYDDTTNISALTFSEFKLQLINYARFNKPKEITNFLSKRLNYQIYNDVAKAHSSKINNESTREIYDTSSSIIGNITKFKTNHEVSTVISGQSTKNGWFNKPFLEVPGEQGFSQEEIIFVKRQIGYFDRLLESIPVNKVSGVDKTLYEIISSQILQDLEELINIYKVHLVMIEKLGVESLGKQESRETKIAREIRIKNFFDELQATRLSRNKISDLSHIGISESQLADKLKEISYLAYKL